MLNSIEVLADALGNQLAVAYTRAFSGREPRYTELIAEAARLILERIGSSDALYHSAEHTALVTLVGQDILRGERLRREVTAEDWLHFTLAALTHDIGYVRGICREDRPEAYVIDDFGEDHLTASRRLRRVSRPLACRALEDRRARTFRRAPVHRLGSHLWRD